MPQEHNAEDLSVKDKYSVLLPSSMTLQKNPETQARNIFRVKQTTLERSLVMLKKQRSWMGHWAAWDSGNCPFPWQRVGTRGSWRSLPTKSLCDSVSLWSRNQYFLKIFTSYILLLHSDKYICQIHLYSTYFTAGKITSAEILFHQCTGNRNYLPFNLHRFISRFSLEQHVLPLPYARYPHEISTWNLYSGLFKCMFAFPLQLPLMKCKEFTWLW